jgi:hypothetical protein
MLKLLGTGKGKWKKVTRARVGHVGQWDSYPESLERQQAFRSSILLPFVLLPVSIHLMLRDSINIAGISVSLGRADSSLSFAAKFSHGNTFFGSRWSVCGMHPCGIKMVEKLQDPISCASAIHTALKVDVG